MNYIHEFITEAAAIIRDAAEADGAQGTMEAAYDRLQALESVLTGWMIDSSEQAALYALTEAAMAVLESIETA